MSPPKLNFREIRNYSTPRLNADKIEDIPLSPRFGLEGLMELCCVQFDLAALKKICFQVPLEEFVNIRLRVN